MSAGNTLNSQQAGPRYATPEEVCAAIERLTFEEDRKLNYLARRHARFRGLGDQHSDLLYESYARALNRKGDHRWDMAERTFLEFMGEVVRITANTLRNRLLVDRRRPSHGMRYVSGTANDPDGTDLLDQCPSPEADAARAYAAKEAVGAVLTLFKDDADAMAVIRCYYGGAVKRSEVMEELKLSEKEYATITKRMDRRIERAGLTFGPEVNSWQGIDRMTKRNF
ncbi:MAG: hypothetical protein LC785_05975 [Acidobacteria bacterium]|nr:hypothetical protein [Acidobacteriota bacterium]MCA1641493.1 hypothetical protein [Acidobacteriota bacterium]